jgi:hypothetical protein
VAREHLWLPVVVHERPQHLRDIFDGGQRVLVEQIFFASCTNATSAVGFPSVMKVSLPLGIGYARGVNVLDRAAPFQLLKLTREIRKDRSKRTRDYIRLLDLDLGLTLGYSLQSEAPRLPFPQLPFCHSPRPCQNFQSDQPYQDDSISSCVHDSYDRVQIDQVSPVSTSGTEVFQEGLSWAVRLLLCAPEDFHTNSIGLGAFR